MTTDTERQARATIWITFRDSSLAVKTILLGVFVNRVGGFLNLFLVLYLTAEGYSITQATLAFGIYGGGAVVGVLVGGALADRLGARNSTVFSMASAALLTASLLYLPTYPLLLTAAALVGLVSQIYRPASAALLSELTPDNRQVMIFAMYRFGMNVGAMAAPLIGFALYNLNNQHYTLLFWGEALIALAYAALAQVTLPARVPAEHSATAKTESVGSYLDVLRDRRYTMYLVSAFLNAVVYVQYLSTLPLDIKASGLPIFWYTLAVSLNGLVVISLELLVTKVSQRWPFRVTIGLAMVLVGGGMAFYGLPIGPGVIIIGTLIWTLAEIIGAPAAFAYPAVAGPAQLKARYIGSFQFMFALGSATGPIIGGVLFARIGHQVWPIMALFSAVACVLVVLGVRNPGTPTASEGTEVDAAVASPVAPVPVGPEARDERSS
jgi:MFS family permease